MTELANMVRELIQEMQREHPETLDFNAIETAAMARVRAVDLQTATAERIRESIANAVDFAWRDQSRKERRRRGLLIQHADVIAAKPETARASPEEVAHLREVLVSLLAPIPREQREAIRLILNGLSTTAVAWTLKIPRSTLLRRLEETHTILRRELLHLARTDSVIERFVDSSD